MLSQVVLNSDNHCTNAGRFLLLLLLLLLLCDKEEHYKYIVYCVYVFVRVDEMVYNIFIIYDIVELFNMHKSFSFYLNIKFFAHKILNALSARSDGFRFSV